MTSNKISVGIFQGGCHVGGGGVAESPFEAKEHILKLNGSSIQFLWRITFGLQTFNRRHLRGLRELGTCSVLGLVDVAFSQGVDWLGWSTSFPPGKIRKEGMDFWRELKLRSFVVSCVFRCWEKCLKPTRSIF